MARSRNVKPGFFENEDLADLSAHTRLLFIGLWTIADRRGILEDRHRRISGQIFRYEQINCEPLLAKLAETGFIRRYESSGIQCIIIPKFGKHQNPHVNEQTNNLPAPDMHDTSTVHVPDMHRSAREESLLPITDSLLPITDSLLPPEGQPLKPKRQPKKAQIQIPENFEPDPDMVAKACDRYGLTPEQVAAKTDRFKTWAVAKGQTYADWDSGWLNFMEPKPWDGQLNARVSPNGRSMFPSAQDFADKAIELERQGL